MPYGRRRSFRTRRRNRRRTRRFIRNRSSKRQAYQLASLSKRISTLSYRFNTRGNTFVYYNEFGKSLPNITNPGWNYGYTVLPIHPKTSGVDQWKECLDQVNQAQRASDDWYLKSTSSKFRISIGTEFENVVRYTAFIVQVKRPYRDITYYTLGNDLKDAFNPGIPSNNTPSEVNFQPWNLFKSGQCFINKKIFKVLWRKEFTLGAVTNSALATPTTSLGSCERDFNFRIRYGKYGTKLSRSQPDVDEALNLSEKTVNRNCWTFLLIMSNDDISDGSAGRVTMTNLHYLRSRS